VIAGIVLLVGLFLIFRKTVSKKNTRYFVVVCKKSEYNVKTLIKMILKTKKELKQVEAKYVTKNILDDDKFNYYYQEEIEKRKKENNLEPFYVVEML